MRHRIGSAVGKFLGEPAVIDVDRFDFVELLRMFMDRIACGLAEAGNRYGQAGMRLAIVEIRMQAFKERPIAGREPDWFQYSQSRLQGGPCLAKRRDCTSATFTSCLAVMHPAIGA